jgi:hypothetical protein
MNKEFFKPNLCFSIREIIQKYNSLIQEYIQFINENLINNNNNNNSYNKIYLKFILLRGFETITNVFNMVLFYTDNLDTTFFHSQKAFYYYVEFIQQISNDNNSFLKLTSRDAVIYVYKKTIFLINKDNKKMNESNIPLDLLNEYIIINKLLFNKIIIDDNNLLLQEKKELLNKINSKINSILLKKKDLESIQIFIQNNCDLDSLYENITNKLKTF